MASPSQYYYRLEVSGGHTGSAFRFHSAIFGTLAEVERAVVEELEAQDGVSFLIAEDSSFTLEYYEDAVLRGEWNLFPAVKLKLDKGKIVEFTPEGGIVGVKVTDTEELFQHPVIGPVLEGWGDCKALVDFKKLRLPAVRGKPLKAGRDIAYMRDGKPGKQNYGMTGDWNVSGRAARKAIK